MKKIILLLLTLLATLSLASCDSNDESSVSESSVSTSVSESVISSSEVEETVTVTAVSPAGAPAFAQALLADADSSELPENYDYTMTTVGGSALPGYFAAGEVNYIYAPSNMGAMLYTAALKNETEPKYVYAANVTSGNLYFATTVETDGFTLSDLEGKDLIAFGEGSVVQLMMDKVIDDNNITTGDVTFKSIVSDISPLVISDHTGYYLLAQPALEAVRNALTAKGITLQTISIQEELKTLDPTSFSDGFAQAGLFVNKEYLENNPEEVTTYLNAVESNCEKVYTDTDTLAEIIVDLAYAGTAPLEVVKAGLTQSGIKYVTAKNNKVAFEATYEANLALLGGELPDEGFYAI